jgi:hypothetical protein
MLLLPFTLQLLDKMLYSRTTILRWLTVVLQEISCVFVSDICYYLVFLLIGPLDNKLSISEKVNVRYAIDA